MAEQLPLKGEMPKLRDPDGLPGQRADLPAGSLPPPYFGPQGDESREPPVNAPSPVNPGKFVPAETLRKP